jgi:predicted glycosyltransferase
MKILICPLNWGLGHATRCVPIIRHLIDGGHEPVVAADGYPLAFLRQEFPTLRFIEFPSYTIHYSTGTSQVGAMFVSLPNIIRGVMDEHMWLKKLLKTEHFDQVISDNRFGMWNKNIHSIYITHQVMVKMPKGWTFLEPLVYKLHAGLISRYNECLIPDTAENGGLSGDLSHKYSIPGNARFIGHLSRFQGMEKIKQNTAYEVVAVISGVEPQRSIFEEYLMGRFKDASHKTLLVAGQPQAEFKETIVRNITRISHLADADLASILLGATHIISRSGYSTIMDLKALDCLDKAEFIPTPGQTEQEYLKIIHNA